MPDVVVSSLSALPFDQILGAPLLAAIEAQAQAALATVDFINTVGFEAPLGDPAPGAPPEAAKARMARFSYTRTNPADPNVPENVTLEVPLLTIVPIPYLRISDLTIDFEVKIHQLVQTSREATKNVSLDVQAKAGFGWFSAKTKLNVTTSNRSSVKSETDRSATLRINLRAVQDEIPEGLAQVLTLLRDAIKPR